MDDGDREPVGEIELNEAINKAQEIAGLTLQQAEKAIKLLGNAVTKKFQEFSYI